MYSGDGSEAFWEIINGIEDDEERRRLYSLAVDLQNAEEAVLKSIDLLIGKEYSKLKSKNEYR